MQSSNLNLARLNKHHQKRKIIFLKIVTHQDSNTENDYQGHSNPEQFGFYKPIELASHFCPVLPQDWVFVGFAERAAEVT